jgi:hypothetical protein
MRNFRFLIACAAALPLFFGTGCGQKSESEKLGDKVEETTEDVEDAVTDDKPAEDAGEAVEEAGDEVKDRTD